MRPKIANLTIIVLVIGLGGAAGLLYQQLKKSPSSSGDFAKAPPKDRLVLSDKDLLAISSFTNETWQGESGAWPAVLEQPSEGIYLAARQKGKRHAEVWGHGESAGHALADGIKKLRTKVGGNPLLVDTLEIFLVAGSREVKSEKKLFSNIRRGIHGLEIQHGEKRTLYSPTYAIASNRKNE
jgi:hypothetical protein